MLVITPLLVQERLGFVKDPKIEKETQTPLAEAYGKTLNRCYCSCSGTSVLRLVIESFSVVVAGMNYPKNNDPFERIWGSVTFSSSPAAIVADPSTRGSFVKVISQRRGRGSW